jgi:hypothetical protein
MSRRAKYLVIASLILITFLLASIYGSGLVHAVPRPLDGGLSLFLAPLAILMLFSPLFASTTWFFALLALALLLVTISLVKARPPRLVRLYLASGTIFLLAAPLLLPVVYGEYDLAVTAEEGYEMFWLTQPEGRFANAFKNAQRVHERYGCTYHLLGWSEDEVLYYEAACEGRVWAFAPATDRAPRTATTVPAGVDRARVRGRDSVNTYPPHPSGFPRDAFNHVLTYETALSPGGKWQAAAIKNYYGPRDVVVLSR